MDEQSDTLHAQQAALHDEVDRLLDDHPIGSPTGSVAGAVPDALVHALVAAARGGGFRVEQLVLAIKRNWSATSTSPNIQDQRAWALLGDVLVTRCISEFYREEPAPGEATRAGEAEP